MKHSDILNLLYDYIADDLSAADKQKLERHISTCNACANELNELQQTISLLADSSSRAPSDSKDEAFWTSLTRSVEEEIRQRNQPKPSRLSGAGEKIKLLFTLRPGYGYAIAGFAVVVLAAVYLFRWATPEQPQVADDRAYADSSLVLAHAKNQERIGQYFRKSKTLLIGIANLKTDDEQNFDLSLERKISRDLIYETRYIKHQPISNRTEKLVRDLEKILIELANTEESTDLPNVELIRSGIHQENLLFKIRMAEATFESTEQKKIY